MADEMMGIEKLRRASTQTKFNDCRICEASGIEIDCDEKYCNDERGRSLAAIAYQIEREHAEELAAAKRDLADEAREAVERLRAVSHDEILRSANPEHEIVNELCKAVGVDRCRTYAGILDAISNRIAELIEHGGKQDVDVAALRELADELDSKIRASYRRECLSPRYNDGMRRGIDDAPERIRKAVEGAKEPEVLGADSEPIREGETVYLDAEHAGMAGLGPCATSDRCGLVGVNPRDAIKVKRVDGLIARFDHYSGPWCPASWLTRTPPDTQERIDDDATCDPSAYCDEVLGWAADKIVLHSDYAAQNEAMIADLLRRQRELDAKTMGGAR